MAPPRAPRPSAAAATSYGLAGMNRDWRGVDLYAGDSGPKTELAKRRSSANGRRSPDPGSLRQLLAGVGDVRELIATMASLRLAVSGNPSAARQ